MDSQSKASTQDQSTVVENQQPRSLAFAEKGIRSGSDFANLMVALMSDIIGGRISPKVGNAACNAGGKLLKVVEMQHQYGKQSTPNGARELTLVPPQIEKVA
jgi:hypothetical protein